MRTIFLLGLLSLLVTSCGRTHKFWDISKFNMDPMALEDYEEIKLLYSSNAPDGNNELKYFIHLIAVSQKTGDTVNILTTTNNGIARNEGDKVFNFIHQNNIASKLMQGDLGKIKDMQDIADIESKPGLRIDKVARDPNFDEIADNNYPTIIGSIGILTPPTE